MQNSSFNQSSSEQGTSPAQYNYVWTPTEQHQHASYNAWHSQPFSPTINSGSASHISWQSIWNPYDNYQHHTSSHQSNHWVSSYQTSEHSSIHGSGYVPQPGYKGWSYKNYSSGLMPFNQSRENYEKNSFSGRYKSFEKPVESIDEEEKSQREKDQEWINDFLATHHKHFQSPLHPKSEVNITKMRKIIVDCLTKCSALRKAHTILSNALQADEPLWQKISQETNAVKENLQFSLSALTSANVHSLKKYIQKQHKKRQRQKRQKWARHEESQLNEQRIKTLHENIDAWQASIRQAHLAAEMERKMKKEADSILSEVRKKRAEANKMLELVKSIVKLRTLKKHSAETKSLYTSVESDEKFSKETSYLENILNTRLAEYGEEERTLQVMLDEEHQVTRESVMKQRQQEQKKKLDALQREKNFSFFGPKEIESPLDPRFFCWQYHTEADRDVDALIHVRESWDVWLASPETANSSGIPLAWVAPVKPSNEAWAAYLDNDYSF